MLAISIPLSVAVICASGSPTTLNVVLYVTVVNFEPNVAVAPLYVGVGALMSCPGLYEKRKLSFSGPSALYNTAITLSLVDEIYLRVNVVVSLALVKLIPAVAVSMSSYLT